MSFLFADETIADKDKLFETFVDVIRSCEQVSVSRATSSRGGSDSGAGNEREPTPDEETLCRIIEAILFNGLRSKPLSEHAAECSNETSNLLMIQQFAMFGLKINSVSEAGQNVWFFLRNFISTQEQEKFALLKNIYTYSGLIRAWIRSTLNEKTSEKYFEQILNNQNLLMKYFADEALLRDATKTTQFQNAFHVLNSVTFAFRIDCESLNDGKKVFREPIIVCELPEKRRDAATAPTPKTVHDSTISLTTEDSLKLSDESLNSTASFDNSKRLRKRKNFRSRDNVDDENDKDEDENEDEDEDEDEDGEGVEGDDDNEINQETVSFSSVNCLTTNADGKHYKLRTIASSGANVASSSSSSSFLKSGTGVDEIASDIGAVIRVIEQRKDTEIKSLQEKVANLSAENAKLKTQLKNYMDGITSLRESAAATQNSTDSDLVKLFEDRFMKFADMHAELLEFNNVLQNEIQQKDLIIEKYQRELIGIRGPLADDDNNDNESFLSATSNYVSIWVPSAFLTGTGSSAHHVYQIYIKAGNDDWNIYRRYSQFYALHCDLKKIDSVVTTFGFPPKKKIRNKKESLVEKRKYKFQSYLRKIIAHWPELSKCSNRASLEHKLNFFKDSFTTDKSWSVNALTTIYSGL